jgi:hypothetical protein
MPPRSRPATRRRDRRTAGEQAGARLVRQRAWPIITILVPNTG